jgi:hypothetical protein
MPGATIPATKTTDQEETMEKPIEKAGDALRDAVGLPPGDKTPHGQGKPLKDPMPHGGLTSDDPTRKDGTPVNRNSGTDE